MISRTLEITRSTNIERLVDVTRSTSHGVPIQPDVVYLTLGNNAPHEMFVTYHLKSNNPIQDVLYREKSADEWVAVTPDRVRFQNENIYIYHSLLTGLQGDAEYQFKVGYGDSKIREFITMPSVLNESVNIAFGSDFHHGYETFKDNISVVSENDVRVFLFGGDFVDDDGNLDRSNRWVEFWNIIADKLIDSKGRLIPWLPIIGNHEFAPENNMERLFFFDMFPHLKPNPGYGVVDIGDYMSVFLLDLISMGGYFNNNPAKWRQVDLNEQYEWFESKLNERAGKKYKVPMYHPAFYSSDRPIFMETQRNFYKQLFSEHNIKIGLCGHDHVYKKTHSIVFGETFEEDRIADSDEHGFIEIGDGGIADKLYPGARVGEWYIDQYAIHKPHVNIIKLESDKITIQAKGTDGQVFDSTVLHA